MKPSNHDATHFNPPESRNPDKATNEWTDHEHVSEQLQLEAQKLVDQAGSPELAKKVIDIVETRQPLPITTADAVTK